MRTYLAWMIIALLSIAAADTSGQIVKKVYWGAYSGAVEKLRVTQDATGLWWWIDVANYKELERDSLIYFPCRQVGDPTPTIPEEPFVKNPMVGKSQPYGFRYGFNERARKFDPRYSPPYNARDKRQRFPYWSYNDIASDGDMVIAVGPRVDRFSVSQNRWLEPLEYWESDTSQQPTLRYFTRVAVTPRGVYVAAHAEYIHPIDYRLDTFWFELYRVGSDRLEPVLRRRSLIGPDIFAFTRDGTKLVLWLSKDLRVDPTPSNPEILDMETGQWISVQIPWSEILEDITWYPIPGAVIADCDDRYIYFINDRVMLLTQGGGGRPYPLNYVIIRYDLEHLRIDAISEPRRTQPRWVALLGEKLFVSSLISKPPNLLEAIYSWRPWPSGGFSPREPVRLSDSLAIELSYLVGLTCGSPALVSNHNGRVYVMDVEKLLDTTATLVQEPEGVGGVVVQPNPVVEGWVKVSGVSGIAGVVLWDMRGCRLPVAWRLEPADGVVVELGGVAGGVYRLELQTDGGGRVFVPLVVLR